MKEYVSKDLLRLFELMANKVNVSLDHHGFTVIADEFDHHQGISKKFLYEKHRELQEKLSGHVRIQEGKLRPLLNFLSFDKYESFLQYLKSPIDDKLLSCTGPWMSYVRQNSDNGIIYASPVRIYEDQGKMMFALTGAHQQYKGELTFRNQVLFTLFEAQNGKQFHHVYKLGNRHSPNVLQGVFSGAQTSGEPIAGRVVLIRQQGEFEDLEVKKLYVKDLVSAEEEHLKRLGKYFSTFEKNNLRIERVESYEVDDL